MKAASPVNRGEELENYLRAEQIFVLSLNREDQAVGIVAVVVAACVLHGLYPAWLMDLWICVSCFMVLLCVYLARRCNAAVLNAKSVRHWAQIFTVCATVTGLLWGLIGTAILLSPGPGLQAFVIVLTGAIMAGGISGNCAYRPALLGLGLGVQIPVIIALFACCDRLHTGAAILLVIFTAIMINGAQKFNRVIADNIRMRFGQGKLLAQVQSSESAMAEAQSLAMTGSWVHDLQSGIIAMSPEAYRICGIDPANLMPDLALIMARIHPDDRAIFEARLAQSRAGVDGLGIDYRIIMDDYTIKYLVITPRTIFGASMQAIRVSGSVQDVTARRLIENRLQFANTLLSTQMAEQQETKNHLQFANILLKTQMEASRDGIIVIDTNGKIIALNERYGQISAARSDDLVGQDISVAIKRAQVSLKAKVAALSHNVATAFGLESSMGEFEMIDGRIISRYTAPLSADNGDYLGRVWFLSDITERKQAENTLAYRDRLLHTVTAATAIAVSAVSLEEGVAAALTKIGETMDVDRIMVSRSEADEGPPLSVVFSWQSSAVRADFKFADPAMQILDEAALSAWRRPLLDGHPVIAHRATAADAVRAMMEQDGAESVLLMPIIVGGQFWGFLGIDTCTAARDWAASEIETMGILADITGSLIVREQARVALATSEQRFRLLTSTARDAVILSDEQGNILQWNRGAQDIFGYTAAEAVGQHMIRLLVPQSQKADVIKRLVTVNETVSLNMEMPIRRKDGTLTDIEFSASAARFGDRLELITIVRDITARKTAAQKLQFANTLLGTQMEASPDGILVVDSHRKMVSCNQRFADMWRLTPGMLNPGDDEMRRAHIIAQIAEPVSYQARIDHLGAHPDEVGEDELITADGRTLESYTRSLISAAGERLGRVWFFRDVTERKSAEQKLLFANTLMRTQMEASPDGVYVVGPANEILSYNQRFADMFQIAEADLQGTAMKVRGLIAALVKDPPSFAAKLAHLLADPNETLDAQIETSDGRMMEVLAVSLQAQGQIFGRAWFIRDVTARRAAEQKLLLANTLLTTQMEAALDGIYVVDSSGRILSFNRRFAEIWSIPLNLLQGGRTADVRAHVAALVVDSAEYEARIAHINQRPGEAADDVLDLKDGRTIEQHSVSLMVGGQNLGRAWFCRDVTARRAAEALALRHARYDVLTGLANRAVFIEAINQAIAHARRDNTGFAVLFLDLDHFKDVNDTLGHPAGDALLKAVAARLLGATRETDTVGRFGGDEFAVILSSIQDAAAAALLAERLITAINIPLVIEPNTVHVRASIGIELFSSNAEDSETLLAHADVALYRAKAEGRGTFRFFTNAMDRDVRGRVTLGTELREALRAGQFLLLYQPQVEACTGAITGVEALIRWQHPTRGLLTPEIFIEAAETTGVIDQLGHFVLWAACRQAAAWRQAGLKIPRISFNVSALQFKASRTVEADVMAALAATGLPPAMLELELTESALMSTSQENSDVLRRLRKHGVKLAIDDFGTGYSSLEYLSRFPADHIKIGRSFTMNVETEASNASIVRAIIGLANEMNITSIAKGIENRAQMDLIASWGCTQMQGFYFSRPLQAEKLVTLLQSGNLLRPSNQHVSFLL